MRALHHIWFHISIFVFDCHPARIYFPLYHTHRTTYPRTKRVRPIRVCSRLPVIYRYMWDKIHARLSVLFVLVSTQITSRTVEQKAINFTLSLFRLPHCLALLLLLLSLIEWTYRGAGNCDNIMTILMIMWKYWTRLALTYQYRRNNSNTAQYHEQTVKCDELHSLVCLVHIHWFICFHKH